MRKMKKMIIKTAVLVIAAGLSLAGCSSPSSPGSPAQEAADAFRARYREVLEKDAGSVSAADEAAVDAALADYEALTEAAKSLLSAEKGKLDALKTILIGPTAPGSVTYTVWPADNLGNLLNNIPGRFNIGRSEGGSFTIAAAEELSALQWSLNGINIPAPRGTGSSLTVKAADYIPGDYILGLFARKGDIPYSISITFTVTD
jgi:hypothetical protein